MDTTNNEFLESLRNFAAKNNNNNSATSLTTTSKKEVAAPIPTPTPTTPKVTIKKKSKSSKKTSPPVVAADASPSTKSPTTSSSSSSVASQPAAPLPPPTQQLQPVPLPSELEVDIVPADSQTKLRSNYFLIWSSQLKRFHHCLDSVFAVTSDLSKRRIIRFNSQGMDIYVSNAHVELYHVLHLDEKFFGGIYLCPPAPGLQVCIDFSEFASHIHTMNKCSGIKTFVLSLSTDNRLYVSSDCSIEDLKIAARSSQASAQMFSVIESLKSVKTINGLLFSCRKPQSSECSNSLPQQQEIDGKSDKLESKEISKSDSKADSKADKIERGQLPFREKAGLCKYPFFIQLPMSEFKNSLPASGPIVKIDFSTDKNGGAELKILNNQNIGTNFPIPDLQILRNPWTDVPDVEPRIVQVGKTPPLETTTEENNNHNKPGKKRKAEQTTTTTTKKKKTATHKQKKKEEADVPLPPPPTKKVYTFTGHYHLPSMLLSVKKPKISKFVDLFFIPGEPFVVRCMIESPHSFWMTYLKSLQIRDESSVQDGALSIDKITDKMIEIDARCQQKAPKKVEELQALAIQEISASFASKKTSTN